MKIFSNYHLQGRQGFTMIEILIVISIIAILAATIIPNFIGFDSEARVSATKSNLEAIRTRINLYRAKESAYPEKLEDLTTKFYTDQGVKKAYLKKIPVEMISDKKGSKKCTNTITENGIMGDGGWVYFTDTADVRINSKGKLGSKWGSFSEEDASEW